MSSKLPISYRLKHAFRKYAYPVIAAAAITSPSSITYLTSERPSEERTAVIGEAQYARLEQDVNGLVRAQNHYQQLKIDLNALKQQELATSSPQFKSAMEAKALEEKQARVQAEGAVKDFAERLLLSQGISEQDAINLWEKAAGTGVKFPVLDMGIHDYSIKDRMTFLDECQLDGSTASQVQACQDKAAINEGQGNVIKFLFGQVVGGIVLLALSGLGGVLLTESLNKQRQKFEDENKEPVAERTSVLTSRPEDATPDPVVSPTVPALPPKKKGLNL